MDVGFTVGERGGDIAQQPRPIEGFDLYPYEERARLLGSPVDIDHSLGAFGQRSDVRAIRPVHRHTSTDRDEPDDVVSGHRPTALRHPNKHVFESLDDDVACCRSSPFVRHREALCHDSLCRVLGPEFSCEALRNGLGAGSVLAHRPVETIEVYESELVGNSRELCVHTLEG